jgi:hypothetical protein
VQAAAERKRTATTVSALSEAGTGYHPMVAYPTHHVHEAVISLADGTDPQAVGAAVTTELCGAAEHDGPCRWPHNNAVVPGDEISVFRTVFIAEQSEEREVRRRIRSALRSSDDWDVASDRTRSLTPDEHALAARLARTAQRADPA